MSDFSWRYRLSAALLTRFAGTYIFRRSHDLFVRKIVNHTYIRRSAINFAVRLFAGALISVFFFYSVNSCPPTLERRFLSPGFSFWPGDLFVIEKPLGSARCRPLFIVRCHSSVVVIAVVGHATRNDLALHRKQSVVFVCVFYSSYHSVLCLCDITYSHWRILGHALIVPSPRKGCRV